MHDPKEGVTPGGVIRTGAMREAIGSTWTPALDAAADAVAGRASLYVYGSVATGCAVSPTSDVDLLSIRGARVGGSADLPRPLREVRRVVPRHQHRAGGKGSAGAERRRELRPEGGLRHYCVHLAGDDPASDLPVYAADARAARGFNGDIATHLERWRVAADGDGDVAALGTRIARKTLLAVAGLVSVRDATWTTARRGSARRWSQLEPDVPVDTLVEWLDSPPRHRTEIRRLVDGPVADVVELFESEIGLWGR